MRTALSKSLNAATVDLADTIGISEAVNYARRFGLEVPKEDINLAFSLGSMSYGVTPAEMCAAYAALANGGVYNEPYCIREIRDRNGNLLYEHTSDPVQVISRESAYIITDMLRTAATDGTASSLKTLGNNVAAKTGTAGLDNGDTSDAWAAVYTPEIAVTVWIGKDNNSDGGMARAVSGSGYAVPACKQFLEDVLPHLNAFEFNVPDGLTNVLADRYALEKEGVLCLAPANIPAEYITIEPVRDTAALTTSDLWDAPEAITDLSVSLSDDGIPVLRFTPKDITAEYLILRKYRGMTEEAGVAEFADGKSVLFIDVNADVSQINTYSIIPRHKLLYASGVTLTGTESCSVTIEPDGIFNDIARIISSDEKIPNVETITDPLF